MDDDFYILSAITDLTDGLMVAVCQGIIAGLTPRSSASFVGVPARVWEGWTQSGRYDVRLCKYFTPEARLVLAVEQADAHAQRRHLSVLNGESSDSALSVSQTLGWIASRWPASYGGQVQDVRDDDIREDRVQRDSLRIVTERLASPVADEDEEDDERTHH